MRPRFGFLVHPLLPWHRRVMGVRRAHTPLALGRGAGIEAVGVGARLVLPTREGPVDAVIVSVPDTADALVADQGRALAHEARAAAVARAEGCCAVGLGSALAVVAGRGAALAELTDLPVTTGHAATAWACASIARQVLEGEGLPRGPVGLLGFKGTVGDAVAARLAARGIDVRVDAEGAAAVRRAEALGCRPAETGAILRDARVVVSAVTTGPVLAPSAVPEGRILVDLALPPTLTPGPRPPGLVRVAGETVTLPGRVRAGFWGRVWLGMAQYGRGCVYACLAEPLAMARLGVPSFSAGRRLAPEAVEEVGRALERLGYYAVVRAR